MRIQSRIPELPIALRFLAVCSAIAACGFVWLGMEMRFGSLLNGALLTLLLTLQFRSGANSNASGDRKNPLELPFVLARDATVFERYEQISRALLTISQSSDPVYRGVALQSIEVIEARLMLGETYDSAIGDLARDAVRSGLMPVINSMAVAGIVSLPGMMTGQILAGSDPSDAVRYQIMIWFLIAAGCGFGMLIAVRLTARRLFDERDRLRLERLRGEG